MSTLRAALLQFDGKQTGVLKDALPLARVNTADLLGLCGDNEVAVAATWVVKALTEEGAVIDLSAAFATLKQQTDWAAQLHLLQCVKYAPDAATGFVPQIQNLLDARQVLVRVWALDAFVRIAEIAPEYRATAQALVKGAQNDKMASFRARARDLKVICAAW